LGLEKPNSGRDRGETFFPNSGSDLDSDETFQISRNVGFDIDEIVCLLDSQPWPELTLSPSQESINSATGYRSSSITVLSKGVETLHVGREPRNISTLD
jgi:hypothetical protein